MGNTNSNSNDGSAADSTEPNLHGWRVISVLASGPASGVGCVPYFDVITHIDNQRLAASPESVSRLVVENQTITLTLLNYATRRIRDVQVKPQRFHGPGLLGLMIKYDNVASADTEVIHIITVFAGSPAANAGLESGSDYLLGTQTQPFKGYTQLDSWLREHVDQSSTLYVFNSRRYTVRCVQITPTRQWGSGEQTSLLGADVGVGYLHKLPLEEGREVGVEATAASQPVSTTSTSPQLDLPLTGLQQDAATAAQQTPTPASIPQAATSSALPSTTHPALYAPANGHQRAGDLQSQDDSQSVGVQHVHAPPPRPEPFVYEPTTTANLTGPEQQSAAASTSFQQQQSTLQTQPPTTAVNQSALL